MDHAHVCGGVVRRLWPVDIGAFREHLLRLDEESRCERFAMPVTDQFLSNYADQSFGIDDVIYGFYVDGVLRGAAELRGVGFSSNAQSAEAAFSVEKEWRRMGIGAELMGRIVLSARNRGANMLYMSCLTRNRAMQGLARKFEADLQFEADESTGRLVARPLPARQFWDDWMDDASSFATAMLDLQTRLFSLQGRRRYKDEAPVA